MIKCEDFNCGYYNKKKKQGCSREADPYTCKGYLNTIISIQQGMIEHQEKEIHRFKFMIEHGLGYEDMINDI